MITMAHGECRDLMDVPFNDGIVLAILLSSIIGRIDQLAKAK